MKLSPFPSAVKPSAAVAVIVAGGRILMIRRAEMKNDPWSGQISFPGGRLDGEEASLEAAVRETREEVGVDLTQAKFLGYLGVFSTYIRNLTIEACVFEAGTEPIVTPNEEVASYRWVPLSVFESKNLVVHRVPRKRTKDFAEYHAFRYEDYEVWGIAERIAEKLASVS